MVSISKVPCVEPDWKDNCGMDDVVVCLFAEAWLNGGSIIEVVLKQLK